MVRGDVWGPNGVGEAVPNMPRAPRERFLTLHVTSGDYGRTSPLLLMAVFIPQV